MTIAATDNAKPKPKRRRQIVAALLGGAVLAAGIGFAVWVWLPTRVSDPPVPELAGAEPIVAEAIETARHRVTANLRSAAAWGHLGMVLHAHDYLPEAQQCYAQAGKLDATDPRWPYLEALTLLKGSLDARAGLHSLEQAVERGGGVAAPRLRLAEALLEQGRLDEAESHFRRALERDPNDARALLGLGHVAHFRGDLKASLHYLRLSAKAAPRVRATHVLLAEVYHRLGEERNAEDERRRATQSMSDPGWPDPYFEETRTCAVGVLPDIDKATALFQSGRGAEAAVLMQQTIARHPDALLAYLALGRFCNQRGDPTQAERVLREALRRQPDAFEAHFELGTALQLQKRDTLAAACYRQTVTLKPDYAPAHYQLGRCLLRQGDRSGALEAFRAAVRYRPNFAVCHRDLALLLLERGATGEALLHFQQAVRLNPTDPQANPLRERLLKQIVIPLGN